MTFVPLNGVDLFYLALVVLIAVCYSMATIRRIVIGRANSRARIAEARAREAEAKAAVQAGEETAA